MLSAQPIGIGPEAIEEVKTGLRIVNRDEDALAGRLLGSAAGLCEQFTGRAVLRRGFTEVLGAPVSWTRLEACPVQVISGVELIGPDGAATPIEPGAYQIDIDAAGEGWVRLTGVIRSGRVRVRYEAGLAASWADLPASCRSR